MNILKPLCYMCFGISLTVFYLHISGNTFGNLSKKSEVFSVPKPLPNSEKKAIHRQPKIAPIDNNVITSNVANGKLKYEEIVDTSDTSYEPMSHWPNDTHCKRFQVKFGRNLTFTYLESIPRSGNTWTRYLLEGATGIFTGAEGFSPKMEKMGFRGQKEPLRTGRTLVTKTHAIIKTSDPAIYIIRRPQEVVMSLWNLFSTKGFVDTVPEKSYKTEDFDKFFNWATMSYNKSITGFLGREARQCIVFYENIVQHPIGEVKRMLDFLNIEEDPERLACLKKHIQGPAKRQHEEIDPYNDEQKVRLKYVILYLKNLLHSKGIRMPECYMDI